MHPLDSFARDANKALKRLDVNKERTCKMPFNKGGECNAQAFIRVASKLFTSDSCGDSTELRSFLKEKGFPQQIPRWVGNRFNILFYSAGRLHLIGEAIVDYFRLVNKPTNDLHRAFVNAWNIDNIRHLRCLGLVGALVARPWMEVVSEGGNILEMNNLYESAANMLTKWSEEPQSMLRDNCTVFGTPPVKDEVLTALLSQPFKDDMVGPLKAILTSILDVIRRQLGSQLPGGQFWESSEVLKEQAASCCNSNISGERNFAQLDSHLHHAPNIGIGKIESKVMFKANATRHWLQNKPQGSRKELIRNNIKAGAKERKREMENKVTYREKVKRRVREKQQKLTEKAEKARNKVEELIESILQDGVIEHRDECETKVNGMSKTRATGMLKAQIQFRTKILGQDIGKHALSKCSVDELKNILLSIPEPTDKNFLTDVKDPGQIINREFVQKWEKDEKEQWYNATVINLKDGEFEVSYQGNNELFYMTIAEFFTDIHLGDICYV